MCKYTDIDLVIRENTEDLYAGIEFEHDTPDAEKIRRDRGVSGAKIADHPVSPSSRSRSRVPAASCSTY